MCLLLNVTTGLKLYDSLPPLGAPLGVLDFSPSSNSTILWNKRLIHMKSTGLGKAVQQGGYLLSDLLCLLSPYLAIILAGNKCLNA